MAYFEILSNVKHPPALLSAEAN